MNTSLQKLIDLIKQNNEKKSSSYEKYIQSKKDYFYPLLRGEETPP